MANIPNSDRYRSRRPRANERGEKSTATQEPPKTQDSLDSLTLAEIALAAGLGLLYLLIR